AKRWKSGNLRRLEAERVGRGKAAVGLGRAERREGSGLVEPHPGVELIGQDSLAVVAPSLRFRPINDANEALDSGTEQSLAQCFVLPWRQIERETRDPAVVTEAFVAVAAARQHSLG